MAGRLSLKSRISKSDAWICRFTSARASWFEVRRMTTSITTAAPQAITARLASGGQPAIGQSSHSNSVPNAALNAVITARTLHTSGDIAEPLQFFLEFFFRCGLLE